MQEEWRDVKGYEGIYQVSNLGRVRKGTHIMSYQEDKDGYFRVRLSINSKRKKYSVHRLVATAFIPNTENKPVVNHIDGNKQNNHVTNLEWCTVSENTKHAYAHGLIKISDKRKQVNKDRFSKITVCNETGEIFESTAEAERITGVKKQNISACCRGVSSYAGTFIDPDGNVVKRTWRYLEE